jgi:hypothetical protein
MNDNLSCLADKDVRALLHRLKSSTDGESLGADVLDDYSFSTEKMKPGDYAVVHVTEARGHTLRGRLLWRTTLSTFAEMKLSLNDEHLLMDALSPDCSVSESITA